jgi:hypothetical protein
MLHIGNLSAPAGSRGGKREVEPLPARAAKFRAARGFSDAVRDYSTAMTTFRLNGPKRLNKALGQDVRFRTVCFTLYLHYEASGAGDSGAIFSRVAELVGETIGGGHRVVATTLDMMLGLNLLRIEPGVFDRRIKLYRPTEDMAKILRIWLEGPFAALDRLEPEGRRLERLREGDEIVRHYILGVGRGFRDGETLTWRMPQFSCFFDHEGGSSLLTIAVHEALAGRPLPSRTEIGSKFGISKSQISLLANQAARLGFLVDRKGREWASPRLLKDYERWVSIVLAFFASATEP